MSSRRLPGKVLRPIQGKPMLQYLLERLAHMAYPCHVAVLTSVEKSDRPIADFCRDFGVDCCRGPLADVARRFLDAARRYESSAFVRICGDSPFMDQALVDRCLKRFLDGPCDFLTNKSDVETRTFPKGMSVEVIKTEAFERARPLMESPEDFEHVTRVFYTHADLFHREILQSAADYGDCSLAVDDPAGFSMSEAMIKGMTRPHWTYSMAEVVKLYREGTREKV